MRWKGFVMAKNEKTSKDIASIAARGLKDPKSLSKKEIQRISAAVLTQAPDKPKAPKPAPKPKAAPKTVVAKPVALKAMAAKAVAPKAPTAKPAAAKKPVKPKAAAKPKADPIAKAVVKPKATKPKAK